MNGFETKSDLPQGWLFGVLGKKPKRQAFVDINNLLASNDFLKITDESINAIKDSYGINFRSSYLHERKEILSTLISFYLRELQLGKAELANIHRLMSLLELKESDYLSIHEDLSKQVFENEIKEIITRKPNIEEGKNRLNDLASSLSMKKEIAQEVIGDRCYEVLLEFFNEIVEAERFPPEIEKEWNSLLSDFNFPPKVKEDTEEILATYRTLSQIDAGELPVIETPINLERGEICHFYVERCDWGELRKKIKRIVYGGPVARIRITKDITYRLASLIPLVFSDDEMTHLDTGELYLTNKRIIFTGSKGSKNIRLNKILDFQVWTNGVDIRKDAGKSPFLQFDENTNIFGAILQKAISNY